MSSTHTPGPWEAAFDDGNDMHVVTMGSALGGGNPCDVQHRIEYNHGLYPDAGTKLHAQFLEADANARLIAATPDLLAACENLIQVVEQLIPEPSARGVADVVLFQGRAAISKARGHQ